METESLLVDNFGFYEKAFRGFFAASYSLLTDVGVYPVINGSVFYLDDFPSPVPNGDGTYIKRDYGTSIADFYTNIWWPDMIALATTHNVQYTGVIIENYEDETDGETERQDDVQRFQYFGNMILHQGGELVITVIIISRSACQTRIMEMHFPIRPGQAFLPWKKQ